MTRSLPRDEVWTTPPSSTASVPRTCGLWEAGDGGRTQSMPLTCGDVGLSTIHSTYYCS